MSILLAASVVPIKLATTAVVLAGLAISAAATGVQIAQSAKQASIQRDIARRKRTLVEQQAARRQEEARELAAQQSLELARQTSEARGRVETADLAPGALSRALSDVRRRAGTSRAIIERNLELRTRQIQAETRGQALTFETQTLGLEDQGPRAAAAGLGLAGRALSTGLRIADRADQNNSSVGVRRINARNRRGSVA